MAGEEAHEATLRNLLNRKGYGSMDEALRRARDLGLKDGRELGLKDGHELGLKEGAAVAQRAIRDMCELLGLALSERQADSLSRMSLSELDALRRHLTAHRRWP